MNHSHTLNLERVLERERERAKRGKREEKRKKNV